MAVTKRKVDRIYEMNEPAGLQPKLAGLIMLLNLSKERVNSAVRGLSIEQLDYRFDETTPTIGSLLRHIACVEELFRLKSFEGRYLNESEIVYWNDSLPGPGKLLDRSISGYPFKYYDELWANVRAKSIAGLSSRNDAWLYEKTMGDDYNNYFCWFHLMEDHFCHLGQIRYIIKRTHLNDI